MRFPLSACVLLVAASCVPGGGSGSVEVDGDDAGEDVGPAFERVVLSDVPVGEMVAEGAAEAAAGPLTLVAVSVDALSVRWGDPPPEAAAGFRLSWHPLRSGGETPWQVVELGASAREYTVGGLQAGWRYRLRLDAIDEEGDSVRLAVVQYFTLAPAVGGLSGEAVAHDAVRLRWASPEGWSPVGYVVQWRRGTPGPFIGSARLPPGATEHLVVGLDGSSRYVFRVTALTSRRWQSEPDAVRVRTRRAPRSPLRLEVSVPAYCLADEGRVGGTDRSALGLDPLYERTHLASVALQWRISGGTGPYTFRSPGAELRGSTGVARVLCTAPGADLSDPEASVVESGTKVFTVHASDAAGNTASRTVAVEVIESISTAADWTEGETLKPGRIYAHYDRELFLEIPEGARIAYEGTINVTPVPGWTGHFVSVLDSYAAISGPARQTTLTLGSGTAIEEPVGYSRRPCRVNSYGNRFCDWGVPLADAENDVWDRFLAGIRTTPFPKDDPRNEPPAPVFPSAGTTGQQAAPD